MFFMFKTKKPQKVAIIQEGTLLYKAHCLYSKILRMEATTGKRIIPSLHKNFIAAHHDYFYDEHYAAAVLKVLKWNKKKVINAGFILP
ncbi:MULTISPECIES: hypothetical protein [unclassified Paenibacillus]|uniref:hypothetical protein n=1 Tax=unclassified Paenibacillus TaxID=185978 RepID=UPI00278AD7E7|nr:MULTISPECIES: hypothetical protein [unclassified Paenibacillus]MDQ0896410.1 hypothetical protein [Paenibacillus sp. V4I7]MDQ0914046.1 hypothetical protein [Paenibacillus sp. V4I5]